MQNFINNRFYYFLYWVDRFTKTDSKYLIKGLFWLILRQLFYAAPAFIVSIIFANYVSKEIYGTYKYIISLIGIFSIATLPGMGVALTQSIARGYEATFLKGLKVKIRYGIIGAIICFFCALYYLYYGKIILGNTLLLSAIFIPFFDTFNIYDSILYGKKLFSESSKIFGIIQLLFSILISGAIFAFKNKVLVFIFINLLFFTVARGWVVLRCIKKYIKNKKEDLKSIGYGIHLSLINLINILAFNLDRYLIFNLLGPVSVATYSVAIVMPEQIYGMLFKNLNTLALPKYAQKNKAVIKKGLMSKMFKLALFSIFITGIFILIAPFIFKVCFPKYLEAINYARLFSVSTFFNSLLVIPYTILQAKVAKENIFIYNSVTSILQILLLLLLISHGILGVIYAKIIGRFFNIIIIYYITKAELNRKT